MLALVARYGEQTLRFPLPAGPVRLGSDPSSDLIVPFSGVSSSHALVEAVDGGVRVVDAGSRSGLSFAGRRVTQCHLAPGDVVRLGRAWLSLEECDENDVEPGLSFELDPDAPPRSPAAGDDNDDSGGSGTGAPRRAAARLVRDLDLIGPHPAFDDPAVRALLGHTRETLGATAIVLLDSGGKVVPTVLAAAGEAPPAADLARLLDEQVSLKPGSCGPPVRVQRNTKTGLGLVVMLPASVTPPRWWVDVFDLVASRLLDLPGIAGAPMLLGKSPEPGLHLPQGMVAGSSAAMRGLFAQVAATVKSRMDILLLGETGTGKELFARLIHSSGPTPKGPFVAINCAAIPGELLEAELFGVHGRVATGVDPRIGRLQLAEGGTVFLDEIGELADPLQAKLLRFLQEREIHPLGAASPRGLNVRVVSASNRDLPGLVRQGRFRPDLFFRLSGLQFHIPPLRERREDIPDLVAAVARKAAAEERKDIRGVNRRALDLLASYAWPGNVRELENEVRRAVLVCPEGGLLQAEHFGRVRWELEREKSSDVPLAPPPPVAPPATLRDKVNELERRLVEEALGASGGNKTRAARALGITRPGLIQMLRRLERKN